MPERTTLATIRRRFENFAVHTMGWEVGYGPGKYYLDVYSPDRRNYVGIRYWMPTGGRELIGSYETPAELWNSMKLVQDIRRRERYHNEDTVKPVGVGTPKV